MVISKMLRSLFFKKFREKIGERVPVNLLLQAMNIKLNPNDTSKIRQWFISNINISPEFVKHNNELAISDYQLIGSRFGRSKIQEINFTERDIENILFMKNHHIDNRKELFEIESLKWDLENKIGTYCYVLELENGCYYVGVSSCVKNRIKQHFYGYGAKWTQLNKPVAIHELFKCGIETIIDNYYLYLPFFSRRNINGCHKHLEVIDLYYECYITFLMIIRFGFDKVRGSILNKSLHDYSTTYKSNVEILRNVIDGKVLDKSRLDKLRDEYLSNIYSETCLISDTKHVKSFEKLK